HRDVRVGGRVGQGIFAGVGAGENQAEHGDGLIGAHILGVEFAGGIGQDEGDLVATLDAEKDGVVGVERGGGGTVINLVVGGDAGDGKISLTNVCGGGGLSEGVIGGVGVGEGQTGDIDRFVGADGLGGEGAGGAAGVQGHGIAADDA